MSGDRTQKQERHDPAEERAVARYFSKPTIRQLHVKGHRLEVRHVGSFGAVTAECSRCGADARTLTPDLACPGSPAFSDDRHARRAGDDRDLLGHEVPSSPAADPLAGAGIPDSQPRPPAKSMVKPTRWWYLISAVVGVGLFVAILVVGLTGITRGLDQLIVPGEAAVVLDDPGRYTIFLEHRSVVDGRVFDTGGSIPGLEVAVISSASRQPVALRTPGASTEYSFGSRSGISVLEFSIDEPGTYVVAAQYPDGATGPDVVLAVGRTPKIIWTILGALGAAALGVAGVVVTFVRRRRAKLRLLLEAASRPAPLSGEG